jgi:predicted small secreted protein
MNKALILICLLMISGIGLSACSNTFDGAGRDMEGIGDWFQDTF